jgi:hypothetical protein
MKSKLFMDVVLGFLIVSCNTINKSKTPSETTAVSVASPKLGEEHPEADEEKYIGDLVRLTREIMEVNRKINQDREGVLKRDVHTKTHGCLLGTFEVDPKLPNEFVTGVFQRGARFLTIARTSSGINGIRSDKTPSTRGLAIKLLEVESVLAAYNLPDEEKDWLLPRFSKMGQDFTFLNGKNFIIKDLPTYVAFTEGVRDGKPLGAFLNLDPSHPRFKPLQFKTFVTSVLAPVRNPLAISYYGQLPHRFRQTAAKFRIDPCDGDKIISASYPDLGENQLRENLKNTLKKENFCYILSVILQKDPIQQPIEDSNVEWLSDDKDIKAGRSFANRQEVGRFLFPPQDFDQPEREKRCENLSFNPWNSLSAHRPLGNMQRARKAVYLEGARYRSANQGAEIPDPEQREYLKKYHAY